MPIVVTQTHSLPLAEVKARVQKWLDWNFLWPPKARINGLEYAWNPQNSNALNFSGTVGISSYSFKANLIITSADITITASDPPALVLGAKQGWDDELTKILNKVQPTPVVVVTRPLPAGVSQAQAVARLAAGATAAMAKSGSTPRVVGNQVSFFYPLARTSIGLGESQVYGLATVTPTSVMLLVRAPVGVNSDWAALIAAGASLVAPGTGILISSYATAVNAAVRLVSGGYGKQWERNLDAWLGGDVSQAPAVPQDPKLPPGVPDRKVPGKRGKPGSPGLPGVPGGGIPPRSAPGVPGGKTPPGAVAASVKQTSDGDSNVGWIIAALIAAGSIAAIAYNSKKRKAS